MTFSVTNPPAPPIDCAGKQDPRLPEAPPSSPSRTVSRDTPTKTGQAWVNYSMGQSTGQAGRGLYYTANSINGSKIGSHAEIYRQNPTLEQIVGTRDEPTERIFDCTQGTAGQVDDGGEATRLRQAKYGLNRAQRHLNLIYVIRDQKTAVSSRAVVWRRWQ